MRSLPSVVMAESLAEGSVKANGRRRGKEERKISHPDLVGLVGASRDLMSGKPKPEKWISDDFANSRELVKGLPQPPSWHLRCLKLAA